jgi:hypothetical protein
MINKVRAAGVAVLFFALVKPDTVPDMWIISLLTLGIYEAVLMGLNTWMALREEKRQEEQELQTYYHNKANGKRLNNARIGWPMREVSNK